MDQKIPPLSDLLARIERMESLLLKKQKSPVDVRWTATKAGLSELIYALQSAGVFNNGQASVKELVSWFENQLDIDLGAYYQTFNELRIRKKSRTPMLDLMREKIIFRMDALDEK